MGTKMIEFRLGLAPFLHACLICVDDLHAGVDIVNLCVDGSTPALTWGSDLSPPVPRGSLLFALRPFYPHFGPLMPPWRGASAPFNQRGSVMAGPPEVAVPSLDPRLPRRHAHVSYDHGRPLVLSWRAI